MKRSPQFWLASIGIGIVLILILYFLCCHDSPVEGNVRTTNFDETSKTGIINTFYDNGHVASITKFVNGKKHGLSRSYYENGNLKASVNYDFGIRQGEARRYYESGKIYRVSQYYEGELDGIRKKFNKSGKLLAEIPYLYGYPGTGLKEYTNSKPVKKYPELITKIGAENRELHTKLLTVYFEGRPEKVSFFLGDLINNQFLHNHLVEIPVTDGIGSIAIPDTNHNTGMSHVNVIGKLQSKFNNPYIVQKNIKIR